MEITSNAFRNNGNIPKKYTCDGENISPPLEISGIPKKTQSLAIIMHDPDAPVEGGFTHWILFNFNPETKMIAEDSTPQHSISGINGSGKIGYAGPCPPSGKHHYNFNLYALDIILNLDYSADKRVLEKAMAGHIIEQAKLVGLYERT